MTSPQDTERLVKEIAKIVDDSRYSLEAVGMLVRNRWSEIRAALIFPAGREGEIEELRSALKTAKNTALINLKVAKDRGAEIERLRAALERADYYINRLEAAHRGHVVRDLDEACNAWESCKHRLASPTPAPPTTPPDFIDTIAMDTACEIFSQAPNTSNDVTRAKALIAAAIRKGIEEQHRRAMNDIP